MSGTCILVVEDDKDVRESLRELLEDEGFAVVCAEHGMAALEALRRADSLPTLILLDLTMPVMDGYAFRAAQLADAVLAPVPVIVMTADSNLDDKRRRIGCQHVLRKPMTANELLATIALYV